MKLHAEYTLIKAAMLIQALCALKCSEQEPNTEGTKITLPHPGRFALEQELGLECILLDEDQAVVGRSAPFWHSKSGVWTGNNTHRETPLLEAGEYTLIRTTASEILPGATRLRRNTQSKPTYQTCGETGTAQTLIIAASNSTLALKNTMYYGDLCTLVRVAQDGYTVPVARSFDGTPWGRSGGEYAAQLPKWNCNSDSCWSKLPPGTYSLQSRTTVKPSAQADVSRFLQGTTFGPTEAEIDSFDVTYVNWIKHQMSLPLTSHREYFRSTMNTNWAFHKFQFAASLDFCGREYTSWRRSAFSLEDDDKDVDVTWRDDLERWEIKIDNEIRSMPIDLRFVHKGNEELVSGRKYKVCTPWRFAVRGMVFLKAEGMGCHRLHPVDILVSFPDNFTPPRLLAETFGPETDESEWKRLDPELWDFVRLKKIPNTACEGLDLGSPKSAQPPIFARVGTGWILHNPRIVMDDNSAENPSADGGLSKMSKNEIALCSNVRRNPFNEDNCRLSEGRACKPGATVASNQQRREVICGSQGEIANNPLAADNWFTVRAIDGPKSRTTNLPMDAYSERSKPQKSYVWSTVALEASDQLRQRTAWALLQIFALPGSSIGQIGFTEPFLSYYDILVRNSFTNYGDILREIVYNVFQAQSLSFLGSVSLGYRFDTEGTIQYPDENFAREILQLFSIGLLELNEDGTLVLDKEDKPIQTYGPSDILEFARVWTGFNQPLPRSNIETFGRNWVDPMRLEHFKRDRFPKSNLENGFIGDKYPLCVDLPKRAYLMKGAKYVLLGELPTTLYAYQPPGSNQGKKLELSPGGTGLFEKLCGSNSARLCKYPATVVIDQPLSCEGNEESIECGDIEAIQTVKVGAVFYELVYSSPCVELAFFNNGIKVVHDDVTQLSHCVNPSLAVASEACCDSSARATPLCNFSGERMTMVTAQQRCESVERSLCPYISFQEDDQCSRRGGHWTTVACKVKAKINGIGNVAIVHDTQAPTSTYVSEASPNYFRVHWDDGLIPSTSSCPEGCEDIDNACLCDVVVETDIVFPTIPRSKMDVLSSLHIGAVDPTFVSGKGGLSNRDSRNGYFVHTKDGNCCDATTVFEVQDESGRLFFLKNIRESVSISGTKFSFRNPPHFNRFDAEATSLAHAEVETTAAIDYILYHKNTAPFVSRQLIQRFGVSNPSPQYVSNVAKAFRSGEYSKRSTSFGRGQYGDMAATIAAVVLDPEVRSYAASFDPSTGSLREPILKIMHIMRSLGFKKTISYLDLANTDVSLGQQAYFQPSVFSFFSPTYSPPGGVLEASLVAPEAQINSFSNIVSLLNGIFSLLDKGLNGCKGGLGSLGCAGLDLPNTGSLTLQPASVWRLERLLTAGKLNSKKLNFIRSLAALAQTPKDEWSITAKLLASTPQFHSTNNGDEFGTTPGKGQKKDSSRAGVNYRAVIHLALQGGCDSFNVLIPHPTCGGLFDQYKSVRGSVALNATLTLESTGGTQPCQQFGLHPSLPFLKELYDDEDLAFFANVGALAEQVSVDNFEERTPFQLFAHNTLQEETSSLDPLNEVVGTGTLGRASAVTDSLGYRTARTTLSSIPLSLESSFAGSEPIFSVDYRGVNTVDFSDVSSVDAAGGIQYLNANLDGKLGPFGGLWSSTLKNALNQTGKISDILSKTVETDAEFGSTILDQQAKVISQLIRSRAERGVDRDFFYIDHGSFDHHSDVIRGLNLGLSRVNAAMKSLVNDLKAAGVWGDVIIVQTSEFGRTLVPNTGGGTDHGWGGNSWIASGKMKGKKVLGLYPESLAVDSSLSIDERGRLIPTTPWESPFQAIAEHLGISETADLDKVLPNREKFSGLFRKDDLFED